MTKIVAVFLCLSVVPAFGENPMVYIYHSPESALDVRYLYHWEILKTALDSVESLDDLRTFAFGLGLGWVDVGILKSNGFRVVTGSSYEGLFEMLVAGR